jgi:hypothetical protein
MKPFKQIDLEDILSPAEIVRARELYNTQADESYNSRLIREILADKMKRVNEVTGQENDARYIAYAIEWHFMRERRNGVKGPRREAKFTMRNKRNRRHA